MKKNKLIPLLILLFILIILAIYLIATNKSSTLKKEYVNFAIQDTNSIMQIFLADKNNNKVTLKRNDNNSWSVNNKFLASQDQINILLKTLHLLEVQAPVAKAAYNNIIRQLAARGIKVEIYQYKYRINLFNYIKLFPHITKTKTFYVGDHTPTYIGTYMMIENADAPYVVNIPSFHGYLTTRFSTKEIDWRDRIIFASNLKNIKSITVNNRNPQDTSFKLVYNGKKFILFSLPDKKQVIPKDTNIINYYIMNYSKISLENYLTNINKNVLDSIRKLPIENIIQIETTDNKITTIKTIKMGAKLGDVDQKGNQLIYDRDRLYALINNDSDIVIIQYYEFDKILKNISFFKN